MQIEQFTKIRKKSIIITILCAFVILMCHYVDTETTNVNAILDYMRYSRECVKDGDDMEFYLFESCSILLRNDSIFKSDPDHISSKSFDSVEEMEEFVNGWGYDNTHNVNPYISAYVKQSLWEYADWCINEESPDYWHMKYVASQKTGGYSYARQIKYRWYKIAYEKAPFIVVLSFFIFVFVNVLYIVYGLSATDTKGSPVKRMPRWHNDCADREE